jgi:hypothetical protein
VRITTAYDDDVPGAAQALLAALRQSQTPIPNTDPKTNNDSEAAEVAA